ncbi:UDP-4-amino-4,6-dideoxy-N-acetyl-beta-L-altrosamine transaminase [Desulfospira joergensenii]|uniref:UDP-4-amino-4, 6-dideoxy-N-acetyl-beta-L-altrosamine transaminase n=1 Tax=Desulfospira joergensenii TaxID=53329 RepID=UPI0003B65D41|nr:UDP-4-amino-4,6-dideoxy-N-acetyl-beta-L-altrosamine transaminase [Desulfospira joergensenii]
MTKSIPYARQWIHEEDIRAVVRTLDSSFLTTGPEIEKFEARLCQLTGAGHAIACTNGTAALHLACLALEISAPDLGLTSPISFLASANCIEYCGGKTDFIDINPLTLCMDPEKLEAYCLSNQPPRLVIPVDFAGMPADLPAIRSLAQRFGFAVIEDAAHAIGSTYTFEGRTYACGSCAHSDLAIFSFHPAKTVTAGEGGAILTNDDDLAFRLKTLRNHGMVKNRELNEEHGPWYYEMETPGFNYRITDIQCALGVSQLSRIDEFRARRQEIARLYNKAFKDDDRLILPPQELGKTACPHLYPIQFRGGSSVRKKVYQGLAAENIFCQVHYIPIHFQPYYAKKYGYTKKKCYQAETYYSRCLSLPLFPALKDEEVQTVIDKLSALI